MCAMNQHFLDWRNKMVNQVIKLEVEISLEDFFNSETERSQVFQQALSASLLKSLNDSEFVQKI
jgi:hypothetical protein